MSIYPKQPPVNSMGNSRLINNNTFISSAKRQVTSLHSPIISRVNGIHAGCGSCGRK
jgi:hypothetical protein